METVTYQSGPCGCGSGITGGSAAEKGALERVRYFQRQLLTAEDMIAEQDYFREKLRRHNRYLHGWGVVCGLVVKASPTKESPWRVEISGGYTLSPQGDEIDVAAPVFLDLARCAAGDTTDPCDPSAYNRVAKGLGRTVYVAIRYAECFARPVRAMPPGCGCEDTPCEYSRIRDSFELGCLADRQVPPRALICDLLKRNGAVPCPPASPDAWVELAQVELPAATNTDLKARDIDNSVRHQLFSTSLIQDQLIHCCCKPKAVVPTQVIKMDPADKTNFSNIGPSTITVTFSKSVQAQSVNQNTFVVRPTGVDQKLAGTISYDDASHSATFTLKDALGQGKFTVTVKGDGNAPVTDVDNLALDGDKNNVAGGDFHSTFIVMPGLK